MGVDTTNLAIANKSFNKPDEYKGVLERLAQRDIHAITSFIFGLDNDTPGAADRTLEQIRSWPPGLPVFGTLIPFPSTPLYKRLAVAGRLTQAATCGFQPTRCSTRFEAEHRPTRGGASGWANYYSPRRLERRDAMATTGWT